jgi:hypothetical protein
VYCLNVHVNGRLLCSAGAGDAAMVTADLHGSLFGEEAASLRVAGMQDLPDNRSAHVYWIEELSLKLGDVLEFIPAEQGMATQPIVVKATDSAEYLEEQRQYDEFLSAHIWPQPRPEEWRPSLQYTVSMPGFAPLKARLPLGHQHLVCDALWNMWQPTRTRVSARSFVGHGHGDLRKLEWLRADLSLGQTLRVEIRA